MKDEKIEEIGNYIKKEKATNQEAADYFGISKSTVQKAINKRLFVINPKLYQEVKDAQAMVLKRSQILGGKIGKRSASITYFEALEMAEERIQHGYTFEELSEIYNIPSSTICDAVGRLKYDELIPELEKITAINSNQKGRKK